MADRTPQPAANAQTGTPPPPSRTWKRLAGAAVAAALALFVVLALAACVFWLPKHLYPSLTATDLRGVTDPAKVQDLKAERLKLQNDCRTTLLQGLAAVIVLIGAGIGASMTLRQVRATRAQITETATASRNQLRADRYTRAIDQLGEKNALAVRLGGLYALEGIARDSPDDRATIAEILCSYVRTAPRANPPPPDAWVERPKADAPPKESSSAARLSSLASRAPDVHAALMILGRWAERLGDRPPVLNLHGAEIQGATLYQAQLQGASFYEAELQGASLVLAQLNLAALTRARLQSATLIGADLSYAHLQGATLVGANLRGANLAGADLQGANLADAQLQDANLDDAQLEDATLINAQLQRAILTDARLERANLSGAQLQDAEVNEGTGWPKGWDHTRIAEAGVQFEAEREDDTGPTGQAL
jgi:pentapeptide repeat protein